MSELREAAALSQAQVALEGSSGEPHQALLSLSQSANNLSKQLPDLSVHYQALLSDEPQKNAAFLARVCTDLVISSQMLLESTKNMLQQIVVQLAAANLEDAKARVNEAEQDDDVGEDDSSDGDGAADGMDVDDSHGRGDAYQ
jgi:hypothetical protein